MILHPDRTMRIWPLEATLLFANYLFTKLNLRNMYAQTRSRISNNSRSGKGTFFEIEGRLRDSAIVNGQARDVYILTFTRKRWNEGAWRCLSVALRRAVPTSTDARASAGE
jgi:hypothetical protein